MNNKGQKTLRDYMKLSYTAILRRDDDGDFIAQVKEFDGCVADGQDEIEALGNLEHVKALWIEARLRDGNGIPMPEPELALPSGKWLQRVPRTLHRKLANAAEAEGVSLNQLVTSILAEAVGERNKEQARDSSVPNISAAAYATMPKARLSLVHDSDSHAGVTLGTRESRQSIEFAAQQIPFNGKFDIGHHVRPRNASGY